jgi:hypothetical protein
VVVLRVKPGTAMGMDKQCDMAAPVAAKPGGHRLGQLTYRFLTGLTLAAWRVPMVCVPGVGMSTSGLTRRIEFTCRSTPTPRLRAWVTSITNWSKRDQWR